MERWQVSQWGLEHLELSHCPEPVLGPGEVKLRLQAASLNYRDLLVVEGRYNPNFPRPLIPCSDGFGQIVELGEGVEKSLLKRFALSTFCPQWRSGPPGAETLRQTLGGPLPGMLQQYRVFRPEELLILEEPAALTAAEWSTLPCAGVTAWHCLAQAGLQAGHTVLLIGTGGVSLFGLQIAKMFGARVLLLSSSPEKRSRAKEMGADAVGDYAGDPQWSAWVLNQTEGQGVDIVLETGGAGTLAQSIRSVKVGGHISLVGVLAGHELDFSILSLMMKAVTLQGVVVGHHGHLRELTAALLQNMVRPVVDKSFPWSEVPGAFAALRGGGHFGKLTVDFPVE